MVLSVATEKITSNTTGNRSRDRPNSSATPGPTHVPLDLSYFVVCFITITFFEIFGNCEFVFGHTNIQNIFVSFQKAQGLLLIVPASRSQFKVFDVSPL